MTQKIMYIKNSYNWKEIAVILKVTSYVVYNQIAILLYTEDGEYYADLSRYINILDKRNCMVVDTNNLPNACEFIRKYKLWTIRWMCYAEFGSYPIYEMNLDELRKRDEEWVDKFINEKDEV